MPAARRSLMPRLLLPACSLLAARRNRRGAAAARRGSGAGQPEFLSRFDFHLTIDRLLRSQTPQEELVDERFSWDTHCGGSFDLVDYVGGRVTVTRRLPGGARQRVPAVRSEPGNYILEASASSGRSASDRVAGVFHHVSRHLSDRPKRVAVAWNGSAPRLLQPRRQRHDDVRRRDRGRPGRRSARSWTTRGSPSWTSRCGTRSMPHAWHVRACRRGSCSPSTRTNRRRSGRRPAGGSRPESGSNGRGGAMELFAGYERRARRRSPRPTVPAMGLRRVSPTQ